MFSYNSQTCMRKRAGGMTLVEVVIALAIAAFLSITMYGSAIYTTRQTTRNVDHLYALQFVNSAAANVRVARYNRLVMDPDDLGGSDFEQMFTETQTVKSDPANPQSSSYTIEYGIKGFGQGISSASGGATSYFLDIPEHSGDWEANEFQGRLIVITAGAGVNQVMYIKEHTASSTRPGGGKRVTAQLTANLDGSGTADWPVGPASSSQFAIDYGLYCQVDVSWDGGEGYRTVTETVYVPSSQR